MSHKLQPHFGSLADRQQAWPLGAFVKLVRRGTPVLLACLILAALPALAQETTGNLTGVANDATGAAIPGVSVTVTNKSTNVAYSTTTDAGGVYYARELKPGRYSVRFQSQGFTTYEVADVNLFAGKTLKVDAALRVGPVETSIEVTSQSPLIDIGSTTVAQNLSVEEFDRLPKGRSFQSVAITGAFVNEGEVEGGIQVNGASGAENNYMVDGLSNTSLINGKSRQDAQFEYLQEVTVKTQGIDAEYGGALGGVINAVTKSGGNEFHGEGHFYTYGNRLSAGPVKRLVLSPVDDKTVSYEQENKYPNNSYEVGGSLGGYLVKDKVYFFSSLQPRWRRRTNDYLFSNGTTPGSISQKQFYGSMFNKVSWDPTSRIRTNWSWLYSPTYSTGSLPAYNSFANSLSSTLASNEANKTRGWYSPQNAYSGNIDITLTNTSLISFRGGYFYDNFHDTGVPGFSSVTYQSTGIGLPFDIPTNLQQGVGAQNTPRVQRTAQDLVTRAYFKVDYAKFIGHLLGSHNLKAGVGTQKTVNNVDVGYPGAGYVYIWWDRDFKSNATGQVQRGLYGYYEVNDIGTRGSTGANITHLYIQDSWKIHPRLTLNLGLRTEKERIPSFRRDIKPFAFDFGFGDKMAPRLGATYDVFGDGKLKVYGSWGRYYDWTKYELARGSFGGDFWTVKYRALDTLDVFNLSGTNTPGKNLWTDDPNSVRNRRVAGFNDIDPNIKPMSQDMTNVGVEYQFSPQMVFAARYIHNKLNRTIEDIGSLVNGDEVYIYGNPGEGLASEYFTTGLGPAGPNPKAKRDYDGMELSVTKRFSRGWFGSASYVYSRLYGNYAGLSNSDEISSPTTNRSSATAQQSGGSIARPGSNVTRGWDLDELLFDSHGNFVYGRLATDRPHVVKFYGSYLFKFGTEIGGFFYGGSGTPVTTGYQTLNQIEVFANGRGDLGRTPIFTQTDLLVSHEFKMGEHKALRLEMNMVNLFNQKTARHIYPSINRERNQSAGIDLSGVDLTKGYDANALLAATPLGTAGAKAPQFGMEDIFNPGFAGRFGVKFIF